MLLHFPSSLVTEHRLLNGAEISRMANTPNAASTAVIQDLLRSTYARTVESGPYDWPGDPQWDKALGGDLIYALLATAVENVPKGRFYRFQVQCARKHADRQYKWTVDLLDQLIAAPETDERKPVKRLSAATVKHLLDKGNRFDATIGGVPVVYKLQSPSDEKPAAELRKVAKNFTPAEQLAVQCVEVGGLKSQDVLSRWEFFKGLSSPVLYEAFEVVTGQDCGVETALWTKCPVCEWEQETELPFDHLFSPRRT